MSAEELNLWALSEQWESGGEVSEEEKKKVQEDSKKAKQVKKQIQTQQIKAKKLADFLSKVLRRYFENEELIVLLYNYLHELDKREQDLYTIFWPFINWENFQKVSDFVDYLKEKEIPSEYTNLLLKLIEAEKLWGEQLWSNLKDEDSEISYEDFMKQLEQELLKM